MVRVTAVWAFLLIVLSVAAHAEPVMGAKGGLNFSRFTIDSNQPVNIERTYKTGLSAGGYLQLRYFGAFIPQVELSFTQRGTVKEQYGGTLGFDRLNYIDFTLLARMELPFGIVTFYGLLGPELSGLVTATSVNRQGDGTDVKDEVRGFDIGAVIGAGIAFGPFSWGTLTIEARCDRGLLDIATAIEDVTLTNQTIAFLVGYEYRRRDRDGDGIADGTDRCPRQAEDRDGFEDSDGCPDIDNDSAGMARHP